MNIAIIGTGGTGGYFGGKLAQLIDTHKDLRLSFIARGEHLRVIREQGLTVDSDEGIFTCKPSLATDNIDECGEIDLALVCVKGFDLSEVLAKLKNHVHDKTMILPLLNGVDICERVREHITDTAVLPACVYIGTHVEAPGKVTQRGGACTIHFGADPNNSYFDKSIFSLFSDANIKYVFHENPFIEIWKKYIFIAAYGMVTAASNKTIGEVMLSTECSNDVKAVMNEIYLLSQKAGISLSENTVEESFNKGANFPFEAKTSFQRDFEIAGKADERDLFGGTIIRKAKEYGTGAAVTQRLYSRINEMKPL